MSFDPSRLRQIELHSRDREASLKFLAQALDWRAVPIGLQDFTVMEIPDGTGFGISIVPATGDPGSLQSVPYFEITDDWADFQAHCAAHGAKTVLESRWIPGYGQIFVIEEPGGIRLGFYQAGKGL